ncbi:hypothetical protein [uncultured Acinetobacter sp.]|uniref:hypothetical protein n=1 Tax=uncultured Acinetobacter sp. TaxID=165433 RepID=UPI003749F045
MNAHKFVAEHGIEEAKRVLEGTPCEATHFEFIKTAIYMQFCGGEWFWLNTNCNEWLLDYPNGITERQCLKELKQVVESLDIVAKHGGLFCLKCQIEKGGYDFEWYGENGEFGFTELNVLKKAIADYELVESYKQVKIEVLDMVDVSPRCEVRNG